MFFKLENVLHEVSFKNAKLDCKVSIYFNVFKVPQMIRKNFKCLSLSKNAQTTPLENSLAPPNLIGLGSCV